MDEKQKSLVEKKLVVTSVLFSREDQKLAKKTENVQRARKTKDKVPITNSPQCILSVVTNHLDDQVPSVLSAWVEFGLSLRGVGADEE